MCALGLYLAFLLLEDMIVGNYSSNTTLDPNLTTRASYNTFRNSKDMLQSKNITKRSIGMQNIKDLNNTTVFGKPNKKTHAGKVTQKQYEIINMRWRRTKLSDNRANIYTTKQINAVTKIPQHKREYGQLKFSTPSRPLQTTTTSKIEFYYMDDMQYNRKNCTQLHCKSNEIIEETSLPFLIFHLKGPYVDPIPISSAKRSNHSGLLNEQVGISAIRLNEVQKLSRKVQTVTVAAPNSVTKEVKNKVHERFAHPLQPKPRKELFFNSTLLMKRAISSPRSAIINPTVSSNNRYIYSSESTTFYDKIKFFETYDKFTRTTCTKKGNTVQVNHTDGNVTNGNKKIILEHVDQGSYDHVQAKHAKKHITDSYLSVHFLKNTVTKSKVIESNDTYKKRPNETYFVEGNTKSMPNKSTTIFSYVTETARWSEYPFAAVYIYEPFQVHCDAAAINTHWLIASGSCLSRISSKSSQFEPYGGVRQSAFVTYCGEKWWQPERMAYVKYTIVHPSYHPRDKTRQHLYNIGVIQVVNSMFSACADWAPVALMSHQFSAKSETTWALAVGWGLDRFDTRYGATDLPKTPLMAYKGVVYFDSCPGNVGYSKAKRLDEGGGVQNVHCLSLPPYYGEDADPVHGGLLLADGKLIAFYLQEERRPWGDQSAQYTGIWRLIPWIMDIAKDPEEINSSNLELL